MDPLAWSLRSIMQMLTHRRANSCLDLDDAAKSFLYQEDFNVYAPPFSLIGKTVLDLGACCGETAFFFANKGAARVICVEPNADRSKRIRNNIPKIKAEVLVLEEPFSPEKHLMLDYDLIKCDIEGYEILLLPYAKNLKPCVVEVHNWYLQEQFEKVGFSALTAPDDMLGICIMANWPSSKPANGAKDNGKRL